MTLIIRKVADVNSNLAAVEIGILMIGVIINNVTNIKTKRTSKLRPHHLRDIRQEHLKV